MAANSVTKNSEQSVGAAPAKKDTTDASSFLLDCVFLGIAFYLVVSIAYTAYKIRLGAINEFGLVIHEFDPYFNFRATEYLYWNGAERFFQWFDHKSWYPLGRPVGTTIFPGMQFTAVWIKKYILPDMSLNDICCYIPAWFGVLATVITGLIAYECSIPINASQNLWQFVLELVYGKQQQQSQTTTTTNHPSKQDEEARCVLGLVWSPAVECAVFTMGMMAIVPAHLMRSIGGGYDNESIAVTAMVLTFYLWTRSLRNNASSWIGILTGIAYFYMVATWGGYVFVLNLIGVHATMLVAFGRFSPKVYLAYTLFYSVGTLLAIQVPVVGWTPLKSLEQLGPFAAFAAYQILMVLEIMISQRKDMTRKQAMIFRIKGFVLVGCIAVVAALCLTPTGYFGPISSRVRGLFVKHTKTGNPLVDSVAEHQPASSRAYFQYLHHVCSVAPVGFLIVFFKLSDSSSFLLIWGTTAYFFSHKMVRLILLTAPIASVLGGIAVGRVFAWCVRQWLTDFSTTDGNGANGIGNESNGSGKGQKRRKPGKKQAPSAGSSFQGLSSLQAAANSFSKSKQGVLTKRTLAFLAILFGYMVGGSFVHYCWRLSYDLSNPTIMQKARTRDGKIIILDDYREAYTWLRDNTPEDSRVMAWWDYGYQISAIANRTTIADGNTWNHEHIALLGKALTSDLKEGWEIARHLADYLLVWAGGGGDDLAKSPHLARIANSVYRDHCPNDPTCRSFGIIDRQGTPSAMMKRSLLYGLVGQGVKEGVTVPPELFVEVFRSKYGKVRIYKIMDVSEESKQWAADPANRICDVEGSWFCRGQYPPGLKPFLDTKTDFAQLEDFNKGKGDEEYQKQYFEDLHNPNEARRKILEKERQEQLKQKAEMSEAQQAEQKTTIDQLYNTFEDTEDTVRMYNLIKDNSIEELKAWLDEEPYMAYVRSKDGRGPMFWAFELRNEEITKILMKAGVPHTDKDTKGLTPLNLLEGVKD